MMEKRRLKIKFSPSIILADFLNLEKEISKLEKAGVDLIHYDVMDGHYVKNFGLNHEILRMLSKRTRVPIDVHLAISNPDEHIEAFIKSGAKIITVQQETCAHIFRTIDLIRKNKAKVCVAIAPSTPLCAVEYVLSQVDMFSVMTVNPGFQSQQFIPLMIGKAKRLRMVLDERGINPDIAVDGAISEEVIPKLVKAGVNVFVLGSLSIFKPGVDKIKAIRSLRLMTQQAKANFRDKSVKEIYKE